MTLTNHYRSDRTGLSFELFPPKTEKGETQLYSQLKKLMEFSPDYVTCTYGAGGSEQDKTLDIISKVKNDFNPINEDKRKQFERLLKKQNKKQ